MQRNNNDHGIEPRISSLETAVSSLTADVQTIAQSVDRLRSAISEQSRPQWGNLIAAVAVGIVVVSAIGASFISPLTIQISNNTRDTDKNERAITQLNDKNDKTFEQILDRMRSNESQTASNQQEQTSKFESFGKELENVKELGSPITRERLAVLEAAVRALQGNHP